MERWIGELFHSRSPVEKRIFAMEEFYVTPRRNGLLSHFHKFSKDRYYKP
jgi:hypothetical protein